MGTMLEASISGLSGLNREAISSVEVISLSEYFEDLSWERLRDSLHEAYDVPVNFTLLDNPTSSVVETVSALLDSSSEDFPFIVKDCDNWVGLDLSVAKQRQNFVAYGDLRKHPKVVAHNKSFLDLGFDGTLNGLIEKEIIGPHFSVGCVGFSSASSFLAASREVRGPKEAFVSDVVSQLISWGESFVGAEVLSYEDWGTLEDWLGYVQSYRTLFLDLDGVVVKNANPLSRTSAWDELIPLEDNVEALLRIQSLGRTKLVFTTSRAHTFYETIQTRLGDLGFSDFELITGLPHAKRVLVNDHAITNPYPAAVAVSVPRNLTDLATYL